MNSSTGNLCSFCEPGQNRPQRRARRQYRALLAATMAASASASAVDLAFTASLPKIEVPPPDPFPNGPTVDLQLQHY